MNFLQVFENTLHAIEAAASIAAPIIATQNPVIGALMTQANLAAIGAEAAITSPGMGAQKAAVVAAQSQATLDVINGSLAIRNKPILPAETNQAIQAEAEVVVRGLNAVAMAIKGGDAK